MADLPPCTAQLSRPAAERPGYSQIEAWINIQAGALSFRLLLSVPSDSTVEQTNALAQIIVEAVQGRTMDLASMRDQLADLRHRLQATAAAGRLARVQVEEILSGRTRRLFGRARVVVDADGAAWLQDPEKGDAGMGLRFPSLAALWRDMPSLRPVSWEGGVMIVESFGMEP